MIMLVRTVPALREVVQIGKNAMVSALGGVIYIGGAWVCAFYLHASDPHWLLFAFLLCWAGDTAALYIGKNFGRHKPAPKISPGKTAGKARSHRWWEVCWWDGFTRTT